MSSNSVPVPSLIPGSSLFQSLESTNTKFTNIYIPGSNTIDLNYINVGTVNIGPVNASLTNFISNNQIHNLQDPINDYDIATKHYVDTKVITTNGSNGSLQINNNGSFFNPFSMGFNDSSNILSISNILYTTNLYTSNLGYISVSTSANYTLTLPTNLGSSNQLLTNDSNGNLYWSNNDTPGGIGNQIQYNSAGAFAGSSNLTVSINDNKIDLNTSDIITTTFTTSKLTASYLELEETSGSNFTTLKTSATTNYSMRFSGDQFINSSNSSNTNVLGIDTSGNVISIEVIVPTTSTTTNSLIYNNNHSMANTGDAVYDTTNRTFELNKKLIQSHDNTVVYENFLLITNSTSLIIESNIGYVATSTNIKLVDIANNTVITTINVFVNALDVVNDIIYAVSTSGLIIIKNIGGVGGVFTAVSTTTLSTGSTGSSIKVVGQNAFIVLNNSDGGLYFIINVSDIYNPLILNSGSIIGFPNNNPTFNAIETLNNYSYIGCDNEIFSLLLVNNNGTNGPELVSSLQLGPVNDLVVTSNLVFCVGTYFNIINSSDPTNPTIIYTLLLGDSSDIKSSIVVNNRYAYVSNETSGSIYLIDVSDIYNPVLISTYTNINLIGINSLIITDKLYCVSTNLFNTIGISSNFINTTLIGTIQTNGVNAENIVSNNLSCSNNITANTILSDKVSLFNSNTIEITWTTPGPHSITVIDQEVNLNSIIIPEISYINTQFGFPQVCLNGIENGQFGVIVNNIHSTQEIPVGSLIRVGYVAL